MKKPGPLVVVETDLRRITRDSDQLECTVTIHLGRDRAAREILVRWLQMGAVEIHRQRERDDGGWCLQAHLADNASDLDHSTAWAVRLPLIGLRLGDLGVYMSRTHLTAWIDPEIDEGDRAFGVPRPGYNPMALPGVKQCSGVYDGKTSWCKWADGEPHVIVPDEFYTPPFDAELYEVVRGRRVDIVVGPASKEREAPVIGARP
jgi:hypothetical protein